MGETGATIYVTDIESRNRKTSELPGSVEDTAEQLTERGGVGIPVRLDHTDDDAVAETIKREHGVLDLLVANAFNGNAIPFKSDPFWKLSLTNWHNMIDNGLRNHLVAAWHAAPLLNRRKGRIVLTGLKTSDEGIMGNLFNDLAMNGISKLTHALNYELSTHGVTSVAISPGFTRTEAIMAVMGGN
ncbi:SDR family oxidoreductase [Paenibacillus mendelii]|nr:SDR family oxidoreductase [Paenibacillus mendelii]